MKRACALILVWDAVENLGTMGSLIIGLATIALLVWGTHRMFISRRKPNWMPGRVLAIVTLILIAALTLTPLNGGGTRLLSVVPHPGNIADSAYQVQVVGNIAMFVAFGAFLTLAAPVRLVSTVVVAAAVSLAIEVAQWVLATGRFADSTDVLFNTVGAALGYALSHALTGDRARTPSKADRSARSAITDG